MLNIWSTAPFWRTYLEALGMPRGNVVFSDNTSEEMWIEGGKYGSVDPCFPAKVGQAHIHNLLFHHHSAERPLNYIFNPSLTHVPSFVKNAQDYASCPIVAGSPNVLKAAFTKEMDFFAQRGIRYIDSAFTLIEPHLLRRQLFETFGEVLQITEDESDFACEEAFTAMRLFDEDMQAKGREILDEVERDNRVALLLLGRPYHLDPGLNHGVLEEFQLLGFPVLSIRSIPKDEEYLGRYFAEDLAKGLIKSPLEISDVWPENYSSNSAMKVWAAKFASRHPHVVILDLSSFKCGHDAPTYGIIDSIISSAGTPYSALHDIDANKPGGSIKIRVKTYTHSLGLHQERLEDMAKAKAELGYRVDLKRLELLRRKQHELSARALGDTSIARQIAELVERVGRYERDSSEAAASAKALAANATLAEMGLVRLGVRRNDTDTISRI
jgi:predicted nucleotide-binding protein (sugar kinase/HSP70/actin superfamily)